MNAVFLCSAFALMFHFSEAVLAIEGKSGIPGIKLLEGPERLRGRLLFLHLEPFSGLISSQTNTASVVELDLSEKRMRRLVVNCPYGRFLSSGDGNVISIRYGESRVSPYIGTQIYIFTGWDQRTRTLSLGSNAPSRVVFANHDIFMQAGVIVPSLLWYDTRRETLQSFHLKGAQGWEREYYSIAETPPDRTNLFNFVYRRGGKRMSDGVNYREGLYSFDLASGAVSFVGPADARCPGLRCNNGSYVSFSGPDWRQGHVITLSFQNQVTPDGQSNESKQTRILHKFSSFDTGRYSLEQVSPCGQYAFVRYLEQITTKKRGFGQISTYYLIDTESGHLRPFLEDRVAQVTGGDTSQVVWVGESASNPEQRKASGATADRDAKDFDDATTAKDTFLALRSSVLRRFCKEAKRLGLELVFTDIGPESMERDHPELFKSFLRQASDAGVKVVGFSQAIVDTKSVRDKQTGQTGVAFMFVNVQNDGNGDYKVTAMAWDAEGKTRDLTYHVRSDGDTWEVE